MQNVLLDKYVAEDIDRFVGRVLADLGNPEPPLRLADVRELLRLDRAYYSASDDSATREVIHQLNVAGQQILAEPSVLKDVIARVGLKALLLPEQRRILIDSETPDLKQRWSEAHEIGHDLIPWHGDTMLGDDRSTLTPACHAQVEAEANYAAGQLLFLQDRFVSDVRSVEASLAAVRKLTAKYKNTIMKYVQKELRGGSAGRYCRRTAGCLCDGFGQQLLSFQAEAACCKIGGRVPAFALQGADR